MNLPIDVFDRLAFLVEHLDPFVTALLADQLGHTDQRMLYQHYRELVKPEQAEKWWDIRPAEAQPNLVAISA